MKSSRERLNCHQSPNNSPSAQQQQKQQQVTPKISVMTDQPPALPSRDASPAQAPSEEPNFYLNDPGVLRTSIVAELDDAASVASDVPKSETADVATSSSAAAGDSPQLSALAQAMPMITLEINKVVYKIARANISVTTSGDQANLNVSVDIAAPEKQAEDQSSYVKSIKTSFRSSKRAIVGAAHKLFKPAKYLLPAGSELFEPSLPSPSASAEADFGAADGNLLTASAAQQVGQSIGSEASTSMGDAENQPRLNTVHSQESAFDSDIVNVKPGSSSDELVTPTKPAKVKTIRNPFQKILAKGLTDARPKSTSKSSLPTSPEPDPGAEDFPTNLPASLKAFFEITPHTKLQASVFAADTSSIAKEIREAREKQIPEASKRKVKVKGKSRSVWLDPSPGEKMEIWKLYYDVQNRCHRLLARLSGTDLFGYILPLEIDQSRRFDSTTEQAAYEVLLQGLSMAEDMYDLEETQATQSIQDNDEELVEIYM